MNSRDKFPLALFAISQKIYLKKESPNADVANCVSSLTYQTGIWWLNIFTNPGSWSAERMSKVPKLLYKNPLQLKYDPNLIYPSEIFVLSKPNTKHAKICMHKECLQYHQKCSLFPWWKKPCTTLLIL